MLKRTVIQASAGTGKTFRLAQRVLERVASGTPIGCIVVVTFTVAATAELNARVRARLSEAEVGLRARAAGAEWAAPDETLEAFVDSPPASALQNIRQALVDFDEACIHTIHGFCRQLLRHHAFEAQASFGVALGSSGAVIADQVVTDLRRRLLSDLDPLAVAALDDVGLGDGPLRELAKKAQELEAVVVPAVAGSGSPPDLGPMKALIEEARTAVRSSPYLTDVFVDSDALYGRMSKKVRYSFPSGRTRNHAFELRDWLNQPAIAAGSQDFIERFTTASIQTALKPGHVAPTHPIVPLMDALVPLLGQLGPQLSAWGTALRRSLVDEVRKQIAAQSALRDEQSFAGLLRQVRDRSTDPDLRRAVRGRYKVVFIDEFQDTDPVQWDLFRNLFEEVVVVGDPKQSIYAFRQADIHAYLDAVKDPDDTEELTQNRRSDARLLRAVNRLWEGPLPFGLEAIGFDPPDEFCPESRIPLEQPPLVVRHIRRVQGMVWKGNLTRKRLQPNCAERVAADIVDELALPDVRPRSIAVLTASNPQALEVRDALRRRGVPSVLRTQAKAFDTPVAKDLAKVLDAFLEPTDRGKVYRALITTLMGRTATDLARFRTEEGADDWADLLVELRQWGASWKDEGVLACARAWADGDGVWERLLRRPGGARDATDLQHLLELLHAAEFEQRLGPTALRAWLVAGGPGVDEDESGQRIDADDDAVQIATIHKAKGLEYDRVFLPFAWSATFVGWKDQWVPRYYDEQARRWTIDVTIPAADEVDVAMRRDRLQEAMRVLYVAMTRARHRCVLYWGPSGRESAMGYLLHRDKTLTTFDDLRDSASERVKGDADILEDLTALQDDGVIELVSWDPTDPTPTTRWTDPNAAMGESLSTWTWARKMDTWWRRASFTELKRGSVAGGEVETADSEVEEDDVDLHEKVPLADLHGGIPVGDLFHKVLEHADYSKPEQLEALFREHAATYGVDPEKWSEPAASALADAMKVPLFEGGPAASELSNTLREVDFMLSACGGYAPHAVMSQKDLAAAFEGPLGPGAPSGTRERMASLRFLPVRGFLHGSIDLVFEHKGRFHMLDWKSNKVGLSWADFTAAKLGANMVRDGYVVQYHLYALALHRMLQQRLGASYDYDAHFGNCIYAYVRGMQSGRTTGVFVDRPPLALLERIGSALEGS